jgi:Fe2+ or Zn2+ uptake regulation protein
MPKFWYAQPLHTSIVEMLQKKGSALTDTDMYKELKGVHKELGIKDFNNTLMKLEVDGLVHVSYLTKTTRRVELRR